MNITDINAVYVINLDRRPDRWEEIQEAWKATGVELPLTRYDACDGKVFLPPRSWDVGNAAFGCYLSHTSALINAVRSGIDNFLILEDDAVFADGFRGRLAAVLADLPNDYDQLYLGWQPLHTDRVPPTQITKVLGRAGNCNRSHATLWSRRGAVRILARLTDLSERKSKHHIDHWLGELHEQLDQYKNHVYDCYIAIPQLVYQAQGRSDICGKETPLNKWLYTGKYKKETPAIINILGFVTSYGQLGRRGWLGYENRLTDIQEDDRTSIISLHAPSALTISTDHPLTVSGVMNSTGPARAPVRVQVDGTEIGTLSKAREITPETTIDAGTHFLEFLIPESENACAHTYWKIMLK